MSKTNNLILFGVIVAVIVFGFLIVTVSDIPGGTTDNSSIDEPKITEFEDKGLTNYFAQESDEKWEITERENESVTVEGLVVERGTVNSIELLGVERTENGVRVEVGVNVTYQDPITHTEQTKDGDMIVKSLPPHPISMGYGYNFTIENVQEDESIIVETVEIKHSEHNSEDSKIMF